MPIPASVLNPPFHVVRLNHVQLTVKDLAASKAFWADTVSLQVSDETPDRLYFPAMEERGHHCVVLEKGSEPKANVLGFNVFSEDDLDKAHRFFRARGLPVRFVEERFQDQTLRTVDPMGVPLEFYFRMSKLPSVHQKYDLYKGVKPLRIDHFNCFSDDVMRPSPSIQSWVSERRSTPRTRTQPGSGQPGCTERAAYSIWLSGMGSGLACTTWRFGCRHP